MSPVRFRAALGVALVTVLVAVLLRFESAQHEMTGAASSCHFGESETFDCDAVQASRFAKVLGVSLSTWGAAAAATILAWLLASRREPKLVLLAGGAAAISLGAVAYTAVVSWIVLKKLCLYCSAMQLGFLGLGVLLAPVAWRDRALLPRRPLLFGGTAATAILLLALSGEAYASERGRLGSLFSQPGSAMRLDVSDDLVLGDPTTRISVVVFFDFGCGYCLQCYQKAVHLVGKHPGAVHFRFKHYPLERRCNGTLARTEHSGACSAAVAAQAAQALGLDAAALRLIFSHQADGFSPLVLNTVGQELGVAPDKWRELLAQPQVHAIVERDVREGNELRLNKVPIAYVNGRVVDSAHIEETVEALLGR